MNRYAVADLHGQLDLLKQIKEYLNEDDVLYILGDSGDRGPEPWRTLKASLDDPQFIYLMGNHDLMLIQYIEAVLSHAKSHDWNIETEPLTSVDLPYLLNQPLIFNDGWDTVCGLFNEPNWEQYYWKLKSCPLELRLAALDNKHFIYLSHAGFNPGDGEPETVEDFVWDRLHIYNFDYETPHTIIHGHFPYRLMMDRLPDDECKIKDGYCIYNKGQKINIDTGAVWRNKTVLLNIDTLEGIQFEIQEDTSEENK